MLFFLLPTEARPPIITLTFPMESKFNSHCWSEGLAVSGVKSHSGFGSEAWKFRMR